MSMTGRKHSAETRAKMSLARMGRVFSAETRAKIGNANRGKRRTPEQRALLSDVHKGYAHESETKDKISTVSGVMWTTLDRVSHSEAVRRALSTPEAKRKMSEAQRRIWAERRAQQ